MNVAMSITTELLEARARLVAVSRIATDASTGYDLRDFIAACETVESLARKARTGLLVARGRT